jgi:hypothetical protein
MAEQQPVATVGQSTVGDSSIDDCIHAVMGKLTRDVGEQSGVIMQGPDGKYYNTDPISTNHDHFGMRVQIPHGWKIAGVYHTHPGDDDLGQYFSTNDLAVSESLKVPSYIRFQKDGSVRRYTQARPKHKQWPMQATDSVCVSLKAMTYLHSKSLLTPPLTIRPLPYFLRR